MPAAPAQLIGIGHLPPHPHWQLGAHQHPYHELIVVLAGRLHVEIQGQTLSAAAGDVLWYPRGVAHREWTEPSLPVESHFISLHWPQLRVPPRLLVADSQHRIRLLAGWLYAEREADPALRQPTAAAFLQAIATEFLRLATQRDNPLVTRVRKFLSGHLAEPLVLNDVVAVSGMSKYHFIRRYKMLSGRTPMEDLRLLRLEVARDLLLTTDLPLKEIAPRCGLSDEYRLSHLFRQHLKIAPGRLRQRSRIA